MREQGETLEPTQRELRAQRPSQYRPSDGTAAVGSCYISVAFFFNIDLGSALTLISALIALRCAIAPQVIRVRLTMSPF